MQYVIRQPLRPGVIGQSGIQQRFNRRVTATQHVADDHAIQPVVELTIVVTFVKPNAELTKLRTHRWIDVLVRAGNLVTRCLSEGRYTAHERSADTQDMNAHQ
jgi:hypothetical protein